MKRTHAISLALLASLAATPARATVAIAPSDPVVVAHQVMDALGGQQRWDALPGLCWTFRVMSHDTVRAVRRHAWEKTTGRHRVDGTLPNGVRFTIVHTLGDTLHGAAWLGGRPLQGDSLRHMLRQAEGMWVNDSYWFLMPYKLLDPGVRLRSGGVMLDRGVSYDVLDMTFDHVGLTPGDHYWVDVNHWSHRVTYWKMVLQGHQPPPVGYTWAGWEQHDGLWFPTRHEGAIAVYTDHVQTMKSFPPHEFDAP